MADATWEVVDSRTRRNTPQLLPDKSLMREFDLLSRDANPERLLIALKRSWDGVKYRCHYTGLPLNTVDPYSPLYLAWEHADPVIGQEDIVIVAAVVRNLSADLDRSQFAEVCRTLTDRLRERDKAPLRSSPIRWRLKSRGRNGSRRR